MKQQLQGNPEPRITITYSDSTTDDISIKDTNLVYVFKVLSFEKDRPQNPNPTSTRLIKTETTVTQEAVEELLSFIESVKFFELDYKDDVAGKSYDYTIEVKDEKRHKKVIYKSRGDNKDAPEAFTKAQKRILEFGKWWIKHD